MPLSTLSMTILTSTCAPPLHRSVDLDSIARIGRWMQSVVVRHYLILLPPPLLLAAEMVTDQEQPLDQRFFHPRFCINLDPADNETLSLLLFPWLRGLREAVAKVSV